MAVHTPDVGTWTTVVGAVTIQGNQGDFPNNAYVQKSIPSANASKFKWSAKFVSFKPTGSNNRQARLLINAAGGVYRLIDIHSTNGTTWAVDVLSQNAFLQQWTGQALTFPLTVSITKNGTSVTYVIGGSLTYTETGNSVTFTSVGVDCYDGGGVIDDPKLESIA